VTERPVAAALGAPGGGGDSDWIVIDVQGDGFLHHMVRLITGTLIDIGRGRWPPEHMAEVLAARNRTAAGHLAPARVLCLEWIKFRQEQGPEEQDGVEAGRV
jgi:tRNA U38,U39,U40 pseudouridine synthase TruA